ncbi:hypothetical protein ACSAZL_08015 [Methanosarcina sp. T3]|uniref:hypothetical protein n=1 Tax=Methanosarcina sp. T3 TaxID=3439062 RepID=UPI003F837146
MCYTEIIKKLSSQGVSFSKGLDEQEFNNIEQFYDIRFPPDLKDFLRTALPVSKGFYNWRNFSEDNVNSIKKMLSWPLEGMIFDIEHNNFWYEGWGLKPNNQLEAIALCRKEMEKVPKLIPIFMHRYISSEPEEKGNPVFSVYQTDNIYYGEDLLTYLKIEFSMKRHEEIDYTKVKHIRFWSEITG